jgi:predicted permease
MLTDTRYALRGFIRSPAFVLVTVLSLALGIGANTAIFSLLNAVLLRTLPVLDPSRLVIFTLNTPDRFIGSAISATAYEKIRDNNAVLDGFAAVTGALTPMSERGSVENVSGELVSGNFFQTLGVSAMLGRILLPEDDRIPDSPAVCVLSYRLWQQRFGANPDVIGRKIQIRGQPFTILGVTPQGFTGFAQGAKTDLFIPRNSAGMSQSAGFLRTFGRLKPGVSIAQAQASLDVLYHQFERPGLKPGGKRSDVKIILEPGNRGFVQLVSQYERPLLMLMGVVAFVLIIACANITNILMARASCRSKEIAVRLAVGARRTRLIRQLLVESSLLTMVGAALGLALAYWMDRALLALAPQEVGGRALTVDVNPDWHVLLFTLTVASAVSILCGILPAIQSTRPDVISALKGQATVRVPRHFSSTNGLVVLQVGISLMLLISAGLFLRSLHNLKSIDPGFDPEHLVLLTIDTSFSGYSEAASQTLFVHLLERARNLPGIVSVSPGQISPLSGRFSFMLFTVPGYVPQPNERPGIATNWIGPEYFKTLNTALVAGRTFTEQDGQANKVAIVNERTAEHFWPQQNAIGKHIIIRSRERDDCEIIGVVKDVKSESLREDAQPTVYLPFRQNQRAFMTLHVRVTGATTPVISALMREVRTLDRSLPILNVTTMSAQLDRTIALDRLMAMLTAVFGVFGVLLAAVGLYGVMAFVVAGRTREIGIRMALGAGPSRVLGQVLTESIVLTASGIALGTLGALWVARLVGSFLYGLKATDPWTYATVWFLLAGIALSAAWIPARRAALVDPVVALRHD